MPETEENEKRLTNRKPMKCDKRTGKMHSRRNVI